MNAKELHDLYAPLWAKVPETRPEDLYWTERYGGEWADDEGDYWGDPAGAAALCRVAVEDWLRVAGADVTTQYGGQVRLESGDGRINFGMLDQTCFGGPTIHHALVAAALAVAGAG